MRLVAVTYGTEGDTRPIAALCGALLDAGHQVTLLADGATLGGAREHGVPHVALAGDIRTALRPGGAVTAAVARRNGLDATTTALARLANENTEAWLRQILATADGCDGLIVAGLAAYVGFSAAEKLDVPVLGAGMIPLTATSAFPSPFLPPRRLPRLLNRYSYRLVEAVLWRAFRTATDRARASVGLPPGRRLWAGHPMLYGISPTLLPTPPDWPDDARLCGQWTRPTTEWYPPETLRQFLDAGDAPIYVGFGSMAGFDPRALLDVLVSATAGERVVFAPGWSGADAMELPPNFCVVGDVPHDWLLPRTALAVHHGGSGTTHSAARAGVPSVVLPFAADQFFWANRVRELGIGPAPTDIRRVTAAGLAAAIATARTRQVRDRAAAVGATMRTEDGLATAVAQIHALLGP